MYSRICTSSILLANYGTIKGCLAMELHRKLNWSRLQKLDTVWRLSICKLPKLGMVELYKEKILSIFAKGGIRIN